MARQASVTIQNNASKGLITEATGLNFPENAWTDALNVVPDNKGMTRRRYGINAEVSGTEIGVVRDNSTISEGYWKSVGGDGDINFIVVQMGSTIYFFNESSADSLSNGVKDFTVDLNTFLVTGAPAVGSERCEYSSGKGRLFITHPYCESFFVTYTATSDTIETTAITIKVRDFEGVDDGLEPDERPTAISSAHRYNLSNQGWADDVKCTGTGVNDPIVFAHSEIAVYPPNSWQWWMFKNTSLDFDPGAKYTEFPGNRLAPKGHFILDWFDTDRSNATTIPPGKLGTVTERTAGYYRPSTCAFFAGRIWYSGVNTGNYIGQIYFSQILENIDQVGKCYQSNDPTSENFSDLLATDGGVIDIADCGSIYKIFNAQKAIIVFASNGIWSISGTDTTPFKATEYSVNKISGIRTLAPSSFVDIQGLPSWWSQEGIFALTGDDVGGIKISSLTDQTIKTFYNNIPLASKTNAKGVYDPVEKIIYWVYSSDSDAAGDAVYNYDKVLVLNTLTGAFYPWNIGINSGITINGVVVSKSISQQSECVIENVVDSLDAIVVDSLGVSVTIFSTTILEDVVDQYGVIVVDATGATVTIVVTSGQALNYALKFIYTRNYDPTVSTWYMSFAEEYDNLNRDWNTFGDGESYPSYYISGYQLKTDAQRFGQENYIVVYSNNVTNASAFINVIWDYNKIIGALNQIYRNNLLIPITQTKIMLRGRGRSFQFKVTSDDDKPFETIGWSVFETQNSSI